jgi:aldose sugar dehydrogenase
MKLKMMRFSALFSALISLSSASLLGQTWTIGNTTLTETDLVTGISLPWDLQWGPDDHLWCTTRPGDVLRIDPATGSYTTALSLTVMNNGNGEPGLLGMAFHPDWATTPRVFLVYCTGSGWNGEERLSAFDWNGSALVNEEVLLTLGAGGIHNGSRLLVLPDETLLMTAGDLGTSTNAPNLNSLQGKILRLNLDGSIPDDNPFPGSYVYTYGNRNTQGLALGPNGLVYASEHGQNSDDEFNIVQAGKHYGWPDVQGFCNTLGEQAFCAENEVVEPLKAWTPCIAVNGIEYYDHPAIPEWQNSVLMAVLGGLSGTYERLSVLHMSSDGTAIASEDQHFASFNQRVRDVAVNPYTGAVYLAFNGVSYPGSGPNIIKEFANEAYVSSVPMLPTAPELSCFPNPTAHQLTVRYEPISRAARWEVVSFNGQRVASGQIASDAWQINTTTWSSGAYFLRILDGVRTATCTFSVH